MRRSIASLTIVENHPRMLAVLAASVAGCVALLWAFVVLGSSMASAASPTYTIKDLGTLGGIYSSAHGINDTGQVVGVSEISNGARHAFLYTGGQMQDLNQGTTSSESKANDINGSGEVVGVSDFTGNHAYLYTGGQMRILGTLGANCSYSEAWGINDTSEVVGLSCTSIDRRHAFLYTGGQMRDLGTLNDSNSESFARDINDTGQVVGVSGTTDGDILGQGSNHAFLYTGGQMRDLGTLPNTTTSQAFSINESGAVVGVSGNLFADDHAFLYTGGQMRDLGTLGGTRSGAQDINDTGEIVGGASTSSGVTHAFVYSVDQMHDLNDLIPTGSGWELTTAFAINASGQIVGEGLINGQTRAFLATPDTTTPPDSTPPRVKSTVPKANADEVAPTANVRATFTEDMDSDTIDGTTFKLFKKGTTTQIVATVSFNADTDTAKLDPASNLRRGVVYKAVVTTRAEDVAGNRLDQDGSTSGLQQMRWFFRVDG